MTIQSFTIMYFMHMYIEMTMLHNKNQNFQTTLMLNYYADANNKKQMFQKIKVTKSSIKNTSHIF